MAHVEKRGAGQWRARYRDPDGRERSRTFARRIDAERWLTSVEHAKLSGGYVDPANGRVRFDEWATEWLDTPGKRPSALARDETIVRVHLLPTLGNRAIGTITPADVQGLVTAWTAKSAPRTVRRQYGVLRAILNAAVANELVVRSPCRGIRMPAVTQRFGTSSRRTSWPLSPMRWATTGRWRTSARCSGSGGASAPGCGSACSTSSGRRWKSPSTSPEGREGAWSWGPSKSQAGRRTMAVPAAHGAPCRSPGPPRAHGC